jgi:lipoprotein-anchoring transpeptidase ErfK/SrfK
MRKITLLCTAVVAAGCGSQMRQAGVLGAHVRHCRAGTVRAAASPRKAWAAVAVHRLNAFRQPGSGLLARFGTQNANGVPTVFSIRSVRIGADCSEQWYRVQLPLRPNGITGWVRSQDVDIASLTTRIVVDVSARRLTLYRRGRAVLTTPVAVGAPATPTPTGDFYVNQRLVPTDTSGPFGPAAIGISAFSNVLTGWTQGGPIAIHGTDEPSSIGHAVSNGCIRVPNGVDSKLFRLALAGTPVIIKA